MRQSRPQKSSRGQASAALNRRPGGLSKAFSLYIWLFYTTNCVTNLGLVLLLSLPFFWYSALTGQLTSGLFLTGLFLVSAPVYLYNLVYLINDIIDYRADVKSAKYKLTARWLVRRPFYPSIFFAFPAAFLAASFFFLPRVWFLHLTGLAVILTILALLHSTYYPLKPITNLAEKWLKIVSPAYFLRLTFTSDAALFYPLTLCWLFPLLIWSRWQGYVRAKFPEGNLAPEAKRDRARQNLPKTGSLQITYLAILLAATWSTFFLAGYSPTNYFPFLGFYLAALGLLETLVRLLSRIAPLSFLRQYYYYKPNYEERRRLVTRTVVAAVFLLPLIWIVQNQ